MELPVKILVVDDELPVCRSIARALENEQYEIETALSAEEAIGKDREKTYDVIVADLMMPGISGMELLRTMRKAGRQASFIMVTGFPSIATAVEAIKHGAYDYLPKPFTTKEVRSVVSRAVSHRQVTAAESGEEAAAAVRIPEGLYTIPDNAWARLEEDGTVVVGAHHHMTETIGIVTSIEFPHEGELRIQGECLMRVTDGEGRIHRMWTPISGRIRTINPRLENTPGLLLEDPYGESWVLRTEPTNLEQELARLATT